VATFTVIAVTIRACDTLTDVQLSLTR